MIRGSSNKGLLVRLQNHIWYRTSGKISRKNSISRPWPNTHLNHALDDIILVGVLERGPYAKSSHYGLTRVASLSRAKKDFKLCYFEKFTICIDIIIHINRLALSEICVNKQCNTRLSPLWSETYVEVRLTWYHHTVT